MPKVEWPNATLIEKDLSPGAKPYDWIAVCKCGKIFSGNKYAISSGYRRSCGCLMSRSTRQHGHSRGPGKRPTPTYVSWYEMKNRCFNKNKRCWNSYGGRGIGVCERWMKFDNFLQDMGERPIGTSLDRINNDGNYELGNCRWATPSMQANNRQKIRFWWEGDASALNEMPELPFLMRRGIKNRCHYRDMREAWYFISNGVSAEPWESDYAAYKSNSKDKGE